MTARLLTPRMLTVGAAAGALFASGPALAHPAPSPNMDHEYAHPSPPVVYHSDPVVQPVPAPATEYHGTDYDYVEEAAPPPAVHAHAPHAAHHGAPAAYGYPAPAYPGAAYPGAAYPGAAYPGGPYPQHAGWGPPPQWDRDAWLDDCRDRIRGTDRRERGGIIGGLLGAIGGGIAGNRIADGDRLGGTLIGAGIGGLAGLAIGTAIGAVAGRDRDDECELYLDRYLSGYGPGHGYQGYGYAYPAYAMTYVPVMVAVPQRAVVREHVTTEWVDVPQPARTVTETKIIRRPAPTKYVPVKPTKYVKD